MSRLRYYASSIPVLLRGIQNWPQLPLLIGRQPDRKPFELVLRNGLRFKIRTLMDAWIVKETCLDRQYEQAGVSLVDGWTIIDVGAAFGDFAVSVAKQFPNSTVYAFEPYERSFALLQENIALNGVNNVRPLPVAVANESATLLLQLMSREAVQHSTAAQSPGHTTLEVQSMTLRRVFEEFQLERCDFLKMDCEGAEFDILLNMDAELLTKIRHVCLEYHDGVTGYSHKDLVAFFEAHGFVVRLTPNPVHAELGFLYAGHLPI